MKRLWKRITALGICLGIIWTFCVLGMLLNTVYVCRDLLNGGILLRLHLGFLILYIGQVVFILLKERAVFILALLQALLAFLTNADFTFVSVLRVLGRIVYCCTGGLSVEGMAVYKYVFISAALTLELLKAWLVFSYLPVPKQKKQPNAENPA